jgi:hypothetical protein
MATLSNSKSGAPSSGNNREHDDEQIVYAPLEDVGKLSIDDTPTQAPNAPRAGNNDFAKEMEASHLNVSRSCRAKEASEERANCARCCVR